EVNADQARYDEQQDDPLPDAPAPPGLPLAQPPFRSFPCGGRGPFTRRGRSLQLLIPFYDGTWIEADAPGVMAQKSLHVSGFGQAVKFPRLDGRQVLPANARPPLDLFQGDTAGEPLVAQIFTELFHQWQPPWITPCRSYGAVPPEACYPGTARQFHAVPSCRSAVPPGSSRCGSGVATWRSRRSRSPSQAE